MKIADLYSPLLLVADVSDTLVEVADALAESAVGALAVFDEGELVGVISERDIVRALADRRDPGTTLAGEYASMGAVTLPADAEISDAAALMAALCLRHVPVTRDGQIVGMLSVRDLIEALVEHRRTAAR